ncbi:MAG: right-handed parallel beta-helix repeat-containing protein [Acetivibrio ethanolgignens]
MKRYIGLFLILAVIMLPSTMLAAEKPTYTVSPGSAPYKKTYTNYTTYNKYTKHYYVLRSYLEQLEKKGGGTLVLKKGTYNISNTLYIPSNVTIQLKDGVVINKTTKTGTKKFPASGTIFQCISPKKASKEGSVSGYNGAKNIKLIGEGKAVIDLKYVEGAIAVVMGHNQDISVSGITFRNMKNGHFIEMDAAWKVLVENCTFQNHQASPKKNKEAINLDTPDKNTDGFHEIWTTYDCTPNKDVTIQNNTFLSLERAIGTHKYSENQLHANIRILNNTIDGCEQDAIRVMNWDSPVIEGNRISNVAGGTGKYRAILASGVKNPVFMNNTIANVARPIQIMPWKNSGAGESYGIIYNELSEENIAAMQKNTLINVSENFIRYNTIYKEFVTGSYKYYIDLAISEKSMDKSSYIPALIESVKV